PPSFEKGTEYYQNKQYKKAWPILEHYKSLFLAFTDDSTKVEEVYGFLTALVTCYEITEQFNKVKEINFVLRKLEAKMIRVWIHLNMHGSELYQAGKYYLAKDVWQKSKTQAEKEFGKEHKNYATACHNLAQAYSIIDSFDQAETLYLEAIKTIEKLTDNNQSLYAIICKNLAQVYKLKGSYLQAELYFLEAKRIQAEVIGTEHIDYAITSNDLAQFYHHQSKYTQAESLFLEAKNIIQKLLGKNSLHYAIICDNLASLYKSTGEYTKAELLFLEAKNIFVKILDKNHRDYATSCNSLAELYREQGRYNEAEKLYVEAKIIRSKVLGQNHRDYASSCNDLAILYEILGRYPEAELLFIKAKIIWANVVGRNHRNYMLVCDNLGGLYYKQGRYSSAERLYLESKDIAEKVLGKNHVDYAISCENLALLYQAIGQDMQAELLHLKSKKIYEIALNYNHPYFATAKRNLAWLYWRQELYEKVFTLYQEIFENLSQQIKQNLLVASENNRQAYLRANIKKYFRDYNAFACDYIDSLGIAQSDKILAWIYKNRLLTKSLLFTSTQKVKERIYNSRDTAAIKLYKKWNDKRIQYNKALEQTKDQRKVDGVSLEKLNEAIEGLEKSLVQKSTTFVKKLEEYQPHTWQEIQKKIKSQEAAIEIIRFYRYNKQLTEHRFIGYMALIITPHSKFPYPVFLKNGSFLEGKAYRFYRKANAKQKAEDNASYNLFWAPIHQQLKKLYPEVKRVFVSLDGVYNKINLEALRNPKTGKYLGEELEIRLVSNTKDLLNRGKPTITSDSKVIGLFGFPDYRVYNQVDTLPVKVKQKMLGGTAKEVNTIYKQLKTSFAPQKFTHQAASEKNIKSLKNPKVLHLATHGFFLEDIKPQRNNQFQLLGRETHLFVENPLLRAGLYWAGADATLNQKSLPDSVKENGVLTAQEVLNMDLDSTQLVVLSACETGWGKIQNGEGVYGLQRAFLSAGAKNVLMSLWKVDDVATQYFMQYFYESWVKDQNVRKAYRYAQRKLREDYPSPYYWGAFVLVGR
ncbi:MAG TPA: hypothetical protein DCS93_40185, partial [Microscillaceae bacterium]|nr:hypothetical protein [Microscillaceae bacterium]